MTQPGDMRIAMMLASDGPGGAEMMTFRLSQELRRRGCEVVYVGPQVGIGWLGGLFRGASFACESVRINKRWVDTVLTRDLIAVFRKHAINVVHSHEFEMAVYGALSSRFINAPNIVTMHGGLTVTRAWQRRFALRWAFRNSAASVIVSNATRTKFASELGIAESGLKVIHNGVPTAPGNPENVRREFGVAATDTVFLAVGTLETNKGHRVLLEALVRMKARGVAAPWKLIIAGGRGGDQHESLLAFVRDHAIDGAVHIVTQRNDIADLQALADIFIMPSFFEGMPMAMLEAMVAGNAIIASRTGGIPEAVDDQKEALLVPPGDVDALSAALEQLLVDRTRRKQIADAAYARGHREFTVSVMAERYIELYGRKR